MADERVSVDCDYCGAKFQLKFQKDAERPEYCCFCGELFDGQSRIEDEDEESDDFDAVDEDEERD